MCQRTKTIELLTKMWDAARKTTEVYLSDFAVHDSSAVATNPQRPFLWAVYNCGTHLLWVESNSSVEARDKHETLSAMVDTFSGMHWYYFDGRVLENLDIVTNEGDKVPEELLKYL